MYTPSEPIMKPTIIDKNIKAITLPAVKPMPVFLFIYLVSICALSNSGAPMN